ncbi:MAG TPA: GxxExxY protein [Vicinamibacterales bacterium]|nr:GxxExxY protein [Vicinamibacterales bacterium]
MIHDPVVDEIIGASIKIHRALGPGLLESSYEHCLDYELRKRRLAVQRQVPVPLIYEDVRLDCGYRVDLIVDGEIIVEVKSIDALKGIHSAQMLTYLRLTGARHGLLMNFNCATVKQGLRSFVGRGKSGPI